MTAKLTSFIFYLGIILGILMCIIAWNNGLI
jgi:hypothetical protein